MPKSKQPEKRRKDKLYPRSTTKYEAQLRKWKEIRQQTIEAKDEMYFKVAQAKVDNYLFLLGHPPEPVPVFIPNPETQSSLKLYEKNKNKDELLANKTATQPSYPTLEQILAAIPTFSREDRKIIARKAIEGL